VKPNINSVEVHPQLSNNGHPVDGALVGAGSMWPFTKTMRDAKVQKKFSLPYYLNRFGIN
jgi:hypothetical protein